MILLSHVFIALSYGCVALAVAVGLPLALPAVAPTPAAVFGATLLMGAALVHVSLARLRQGRTFEGALQNVRDAQAVLMAEVAQSRERIEHALVRLGERELAGMGEMLGRNLNEVAAEMRLLQTMVREVAAAPAAEPAMPRALSPQPLAPAAHRHADADVAEERDIILDIVSDALRTNRIDVFLQPVVRLPQRKTVFYECYSRVRATDGTIILPTRYIEAAKAASIIGAIDNVLLFRCVQIIRKAQSRRLDVGFFCNISAHTLNDITFFPQFIDFLEENKDLAQPLIFEFGQHDLDDAGERVQRSLRRLGFLGFRFSMDRVGDLDLDLAELARRNVRFLKLDAQALLEGRLGGAATLRRLGEFRAMLEDAGITLIVEKIEAEPQLLELLEHQVDYGQGYLFGEPRLSR